MKKSIYSLVLADDIVAVVDQMAYRQGTSRSNLINQLLAERLSFSTPEMRMRDIFRSMEEIMQENFQVVARSSDSMLQLRSPLRYKYKPVIRYQLELYRGDEDTVGKLRISFRTTSRQLIGLLDQFFTIWTNLEQTLLPSVTGRAPRFLKEEGRLTRELCYPAGLPAFSGEDVGNAIADYIRLTDQAIKLFFSMADRPVSEAVPAIGELYRRALEDPGRILI